MKRLYNLRIFFYIYPFIVVLNCLAADVLIIDDVNSVSTERAKIELACRFYGLDYHNIFIQEKFENKEIINNVGKIFPKAIFISEKAAEKIEPKSLFKLLSTKNGNGFKIFITGIASETDNSVLRKWSHSKVTECRKDESPQSTSSLLISGKKNITYELANIEFPLGNADISYLVTQKEKNIEYIIELEGSGHPLFIKTRLDGYDVFLNALINNNNENDENNRKFSKRNFYEIAPIMIFLKYVFKDFCWHSPNDYANHIIDDPWLTEPYGYVNFAELVNVMDKENFHTTIAFIPWNYDRSKPNVVSIFKKNPNRLSICIHGNNHDHREFYKYTNDPGDPWPAKPLAKHEINIRQAIGRMNEFKKLTGIDYDMVMVFPHGIAPAKTLGLLKKYNFLATVNAGNIPLGSKPPTDQNENLRSTITYFENFPSLKRFHPNQMTSQDIAINLFLDNPLNLYTHQNYFRSGSGALNETVRIINNIQPEIKWENLGTIMKHLYVMKSRSDGDIDVQTFSNNIILKNDFEKNSYFYVYKNELLNVPINRVMVDGKILDYDNTEKTLSLKILLSPGESKEIKIEYDNDLEIESIDLSKDDPKINRLRKLSDFRDITLSKNILGRHFVDIYYESDIYKFGIKRLALYFALVVISFSFIALYIFKLIKGHRKKSNKI